MRRPRYLAILALATAAGCGHKVGDTCQTNVDCSPLGDRFCDTSAPSGYCTIEGCDVRLNNDGNWTDSCPSEAVCVRFFSQIQSPDKQCDHPNLPCAPTSKMCCAADERCLCDSSDPSNPGSCTKGSLAHCAPESSEKRWCLLRCNKDGDCRTNDGFQCRAQGTAGAELLPQESLINNPGPLSFCVQTRRR